MTKNPATMDPIISCWELSQKLSEPHSIIRVQNLQTSLSIGRDAWGREGKLQPVLLSIAVSLKKPFESASEEDAVTGSTIHYGVLSKAILKFCDRLDVKSSPVALRRFLSSLSASLTGEDDERIVTVGKDLFQYLELEVHLPKASLIGSGISLTLTSLGRGIHQGDGLALNSCVLRIHNLRIPTLIGVNAVERLAKQIVIANVSLDPWGYEKDSFSELEEIVVKVSSAST